MKKYLEEKIFANCVFDKELISKICKEFMHSVSKTKTHKQIPQICFKDGQRN